MAQKRFAPIALATAVLAVAAPALASNSGATALQIEQLGPKRVLGARSCPRTKYVALATQSDRSCRHRPQYVTRATRTIPITLHTLDIEELGPKHVLN